jgi:O-antigen/teichoic acid export membrane protein
MFTRLTKHLNTATARQSVIASVSTITNGLLGAAFYFILARLLGSFDYGVFSLAVSLITTLSGVFDLGADQSVIMFIPKYPKPLYFPYLKLALCLKLLSGSFVILSLIIFSKYISFNILNQPSIQPLMILVGLGVITQLLFSFSTSVAQGLQRYTLWGILFVGTNFIRLLLLYLLFTLKSLNSQSIILVYILLPLLGFLVLFSIIKTDFLKSKITWVVFNHFFSFNKWIVGFAILSSISSKLDIFFTARFVSLSPVGIYSLSSQIVSFLPQLTTSLGAVISPKFSSFTNINQNKIYITKTSFLSLFIAFSSGILLIPLSLLVFNYSGHSYISGFKPFIILLFSSILFLIITPIRDSLLYYFAKPKLFFITGIFQIILYSVLSPYLMSKYSIIGSSLVVLINILISSIFYFYYYLRLSYAKS